MTLATGRRVGVRRHAAARGLDPPRGAGRRSQASGPSSWRRSPGPRRPTSSTAIRDDAPDGWRSLVAVDADGPHRRAPADDAVPGRGRRRVGRWRRCIAIGPVAVEPGGPAAGRRQRADGRGDEPRGRASRPGDRAPGPPVVLPAVRVRVGARHRARAARGGLAGRGLDGPPAAGVDGRHDAAPSATTRRSSRSPDARRRGSVTARTTAPCARPASPYAWLRCEPRRAASPDPQRPADRRRRSSRPRRSRSRWLLGCVPAVAADVEHGRWVAATRGLRDAPRGHVGPAIGLARRRRAARSASPSIAPSERRRRPDPILIGAGDIATCDHNYDEQTAAARRQQRGHRVHPRRQRLRQGHAAPSTASATTRRGAGSRTGPQFPVPGNHEYQTGNAAGYRGYFGKRATPDGETWYSRDVGEWHVIVLDANCTEIAGGCGRGFAAAPLAAPRPRGERRAMHARDVAPAAVQQRRGAWQRPAVAPFWDALYEADADLVLNGHDHNYERFAPQDPDGNRDDAARDHRGRRRHRRRRDARHGRRHGPNSIVRRGPAARRVPGHPAPGRLVVPVHLHRRTRSRTRERRTATERRRDVPAAWDGTPFGLRSAASTPRARGSAPEQGIIDAMTDASPDPGFGPAWSAGRARAPEAQLREWLDVRAGRLRRRRRRRPAPLPARPRPRAQARPLVRDGRRPGDRARDPGRHPRPMARPRPRRRGVRRGRRPVDDALVHRPDRRHPQLHPRRAPVRDAARGGARRRDAGRRDLGARDARALVRLPRWRRLERWPGRQAADPRLARRRHRGRAAGLRQRPRQRRERADAGVRRA